MKLVIVESPAKAKRIAGFLGDGWRVEACMGHVCDLPEAQLGVDVAADFRLTYEVLSGKGNILKKLVKAIRDAEAVYVATDPDREGEAIAWHLLRLAQVQKDKPVFRVVFHAITQEAVRESIAYPRALDLNLVEAQQARRVVDRLVGYLASPLATKALGRNTSAGRVQSVCLRLVVEREREIEQFTPRSYWALALRLAAEGGEFTARLHQVKGTEAAYTSREPLDRLVGVLQRAQIWVEQAGHKIRTRPPRPPFTTASLQQAAASELGLSPDKTMKLAQRLYEQGWITYMRTDGLSVAPEAQAAARDHISTVYGADYLPPEPPVYITRSSHAQAAKQAAHEAIRPTDVSRLPEDGNGSGAALYGLIWKRFIASQMSPAHYLASNAVIYAGRTQAHPYPLEFRAQGRSLRFDGFLRVYADHDEAGEDESGTLPPLEDGQALKLIEPLIEAHQTRAPERYTEATLVRALEQRGIGRPSTYAGMVKAVRDKGYARIRQQQLVPTKDGIILCNFLTTHFADVLADDYTARLEDQLDHIAAGSSTRLDVLQGFWDGFQPQVARAAEQALARITPQPAPRPLTLHPVHEAAYE